MNTVEALAVLRADVAVAEAHVAKLEAAKSKAEEAQREYSILAVEGFIITTKMIANYQRVVEQLTPAERDEVVAALDEEYDADVAAGKSAIGRAKTELDTRAVFGF